jgi:hypothetical protein
VVAHGRPLILTDVVATSTRWGRELSQWPGVYVAGSPAEVSTILEERAHRPRAAQRDHQLAGVAGHHVPRAVHRRGGRAARLTAGGRSDP